MPFESFRWMRTGQSETGNMRHSFWQGKGVHGFLRACILDVLFKSNFNGGKHRGQVEERLIRATIIFRRDRFFGAGCSAAGGLHFSRITTAFLAAKVHA